MTKSFNKLWPRVRLISVLSLMSLFISVTATILFVILQNLIKTTDFSWYLAAIVIFTLIINTAHLQFISKIINYRVLIYQQEGKDDKVGFNLKLLKRAVHLYCQTPQLN